MILMVSNMIIIYMLFPTCDTHSHVVPSLPLILTANLISEVTFRYEALRRFINIDETHHSKSTEGDKSGPRSSTLTNPDFPRAGTQMSFDSGGHVSGCYGTNPLEAMPPVYIFETKAKTEENMRIKPQWVEGLPIVKGWWGLGEETVMDSQVSVRPHGSMEEDLFIQTVLFYKKLYEPTLSPTFVWDGDRLVKGPIIIKCDSGQGRYCKSERHIQFRYDMHKLGVFILPGLPNATSCTQEMDELYQLFKGMCVIKAFEVYTDKLYERQRLIELQTSGAPDVNIPPAVLTNDDIPAMVNGEPGDRIDKRPFDYSFSRKNIFKSWLAIGFVPFTRAALDHPEVRHMLGEGGTTDKMREKLEAVQKEYEDLKRKVTECGMNSNVFDSKIPVHKKHSSTQKSEDEQVRSLVESKKSFSAGGVWCHLGVQLLGSSAVIRAQREQIKQEKEGTEKDIAKKKEKETKKINAAQKASTSFESSGGLDGTGWKNVIMFLVPRLDKTCTAPSSHTTIEKAKKKLKELEQQHDNKPWSELLKEELVKARSELTAEVRTTSQSDDEFHDCMSDNDEDGATEEV